MKVERLVRCKDASSEDIRELLLKSGNKIGSVWFHKKSDGSLRKMCYRLGVRNPSHSTFNNNVCKYCGRSNCSRLSVVRRRKQESLRKQGLMTVFDVNKVIRDNDGNIVYEDGRMLRGAWRTIPLDNVVRICAGGTVYEVER